MQSHRLISHLLARKTHAAEMIDSTRPPWKIWVCLEDSVHWRRSLRDDKSRCRLGTGAFGIIKFAPEANVQDRCVSRRVRNSPIIISGVLTDRCNAVRERPTA